MQANKKEQNLGLTFPKVNIDVTNPKHGNALESTDLTLSHAFLDIQNTFQLKLTKRVSKV